MSVSPHKIIGVQAPGSLELSELYNWERILTPIRPAILQAPDAIKALHEWQKLYRPEHADLPFSTVFAWLPVRIVGRECLGAFRSFVWLRYVRRYIFPNNQKVYLHLDDI